MQVEYKKKVGNELDKIIARFYSKNHQKFSHKMAKMLIRANAQVDGDCDCDSLKKTMNQWGSQKCLENKNYLVDAMFNNAVRLSVFGVARWGEQKIKEQLHSWVEDAVQSVDTEVTVEVPQGVFDLAGGRLQ